MKENYYYSKNPDVMVEMVDVNELVLELAKKTQQKTQLKTFRFTNQAFMKMSKKQTSVRS